MAGLKLHHRGFGPRMFVFGPTSENRHLASQVITFGGELRKAALDGDECAIEIGLSGLTRGGDLSLQLCRPLLTLSEPALQLGRLAEHATRASAGRRKVGEVGGVSESVSACLEAVRAYTPAARAPCCA